MTTAFFRLLMPSCALLAVTASAIADEPAVPLQLEVDLTVKVIEYAQQPPIRSRDLLRIGILVSRGAQSTHFGGELKAALDRVDAIAGVRHEQMLLEWAGPAQLAEQIRTKELWVMFVTPGFDSEIPAIAKALQGLQLITVGPTESYVQSGIILGFELVSGHPKMVFNLTQARQQSVVFGSAVMKLMRIVE